MIGKKHTTKGVCESGSESKPPLTIIGLYFETVKVHIFILYQRVDSAIGITVSISGFTAAQALSMLSSDTKVLPFTFDLRACGPARHPPSGRGSLYQFCSGQNKSGRSRHWLGQKRGRKLYSAIKRPNRKRFASKIAKKDQRQRTVR